MAKSIFFFASVLCFLWLLRAAHCDSRFFVEGEVYCDTCRTQFITRVSEYIEGALVRLECRNHDGGDLTYSVDGHTDKNGVYRLPVDGEHEEETCEIVPVKSNKPGCEEVSQDPFQRKSAKVGLTKNNGMATPIRAANPLGFMRSEALPECAEVLRELGMTPTGLVG